MPKLVILRGKPTSGKSTAYANLRKNKHMENWLFVDHCAMKTDLGRDLGKESLFAVLKAVMPSKKDIIIEEMSEKTLKKHINYHIKKHNYQPITFQFEVSMQEAYKRNKQRAKDNWHPYIKKNQLEAYHKMHEDRFDKNAYLIDCDKLNKKQVVDYILNKLRVK